MAIYGLCPFWISENKKNNLRMTCSLCAFKFPDHKARREQVYKYCAGNYKLCTLYPIAEAAAIREEEKKESG